MAACGSTGKCSECTNKNLCNRRGYYTETGRHADYNPDLWEIFHGREREEKRRWEDFLSHFK